MKSSLTKAIFYLFILTSSSTLGMLSSTEAENLISNSSSNEFVKEINNIEELKKFLEDKKKCLLEIYSPTCPHCVDFAPKYELLSELYVGKIDFVRVDGTDPANYISLVKINSFPSLFIYDNSRFIEYRGALEVDSVKNFIDEVYFFECKRIESQESLSNFINDFTKGGKYSESFVLGVFNVDSEDKAVHYFKKLNEENRSIIGNCYYYILDPKDKVENPILNLKVPSINSNYILTYNQDTFHIFEDFSNLIKFSKNFELLYKQVSLKYKAFLLDNYFPLYQSFNEKNQHSILSRRNNLLIFSYRSEEEKMLMKDLISQYRLIKNNSEDFDFTLLLFDLNMERNKLWKYYSFGQKTGIFITDTSFRKIEGVDNPIFFDIENIVMFISEHNESKKSLNSIKIGGKNNIISSEQKVNYVSAKIVEKLESDDKKVEGDKGMKTIDPPSIQTKTIISKDDKGKTNVNGRVKVDKRSMNSSSSLPAKSYYSLSPFLKILIYLSLYTLIFYIIYRKCLISSPYDESKYL